MVQTFCRHNRFIQRCPICRETLPGAAPPRRGAAQPKGAGAARSPAGSQGPRAGSASARSHLARRAAEVHVRREVRSEDDGYRSELVPGLRSSHDARRLVAEIGFASGRLLALTAAPPGLYGEARECDDIEQATWMCFLSAY